MGAKRSGTTLLELLISMAIMGLIFASVAAILFKGMGYLRSNQSALDAQRGALLTLNKLSREIERTNMRFLYCQDGGVSFADPFGGVDDPALDITAGFHSDAQGRLLFQRYICYYMNNTTHTLSRREAPYNIYDANGGHPPPAGPAVCSNADAGTPPLNVSWWAGQNQYPARLISSDVASFKLEARDVKDNNDVVVGSIVNVTLEMGDAARNDYNRFWFRLQTQFSPRNSD
ncbi:MAG: prepilin-type N-terminal cleavage/methylation domain-containing protein [Candidatus Eremiobacteraeota bacterium]|nr:prepilin-type N-terminal cleavage/methylation domain-containing protein [Candidatus Eremiobacteraeota bacterium]